MARTMVELTCPYCEETFLAPISTASERKYCSHSCASNSQQQQRFTVNE